MQTITALRQLQTPQVPSTERLDFLIVGAPKCGTTAIHAHLRKHPQIFLPERKELHFYGRDLPLLSTMTHADHWRLFDDAPLHQLQGETCIWALYSCKAAEEIANKHPDAKILIFLRNPIEQVRAQHAEFLLGDIENVRSLRKAWQMQEIRRNGKFVSHTTEPAQILFYRDIASYSRQVERYLKAFSPKQVHVVLLEDLRQNPIRTIANIHSFLGVESSYFENFEVINPAKTIRSLWLKKQLRNQNTFAMKCLEKITSDAAKRERWRKRLDAWNVFPCARKPLGSDLRQRIWNELRPDIQRLSRLLDRDLSIWKPDQA